MRGRGKAAVLLGCVALMGGLVGACGADSDSGGGGGSTSSDSGGGESTNLKVIDPASMDGAKGEITYCQGKDTAGNAKALIEGFNQKFQSQGITAKLVEFPADAGQQRAQFVQRQEAKSGECDVFSSDVIWTAEFASQGWIYDMTPYVESKKSDFIPAVLDTATYNGKIIAVPNTSDAAFIYYHTDKVKEVPQTWQDVYSEAGQKGGIVYQGAAYEGLTCDFLEIAFAAGGSVISEDGKKSTFNSPENVKALQFMMDGIKNGDAPKAVVTYMEEESRRAFEANRAAFMRNWPYAYAAGKKNKDAAKFEVAPFPAFEGGGKAGILGGHNDVISVYSKNPGAALALVDYSLSPEHQIELAADFSLPPATSAPYDDPSVQKALPFAPELKQAIEQAKARPVSPVYPQISEAIYTNVNEALAGSMSAEDAIKKADDQINQALATF